MFDVGFSEIVLIFVIGLLILGPERLPRVAAKLGRWVGHARRTATQLRLQFEREMTMQDIMNQQRKPPQKPVKSGKEGATADGEDEAETPAQGDESHGNEPQANEPQANEPQANEPLRDERDSSEAMQAEQSAKAEQADESR